MSRPWSTIGRPRQEPQHDHLPGMPSPPAHRLILRGARDCYGGIAVMDISEPDAEDYKQQEGEERWRAHLERKALMRGGPDAPDTCSRCDGTGRVYLILLDELLPTGDSVPHRWSLSTNHLPDEEECPRCLGTGVQP